MRAVYAGAFAGFLLQAPGKLAQTFPSEAAWYAMSLVRRSYQETLNEMSGMRRLQE